MKTPKVIARFLPDRKMFWETEPQFNRRMAVRYGLDFVHRCKFPEQILPILEPGSRRSGRFSAFVTPVRVPMQSGRVALYGLTSDRSEYGGTGQADWHFTFIKYLS